MPLPMNVQQFDYVVIDGPAGLDSLIRAILLVSDLVLIPCGPSALDLRAASLAVQIVQEAQVLTGG